MPLTVEGDEIAKFYFLSISRDGIELGLLIALRAISAVMIIFPMVGSSKFVVTMKALQDLKIPDKLIQMVCFLTVTYSYSSKKWSECSPPPKREHFMKKQICTRCGQ